MRNTVTLLCLADLHCEKEKFEYFSSLANAIKDYTKTYENSKWSPNYLVVAGDVITAPQEKGDQKQIKEKYEQAQKVIDEFVEKLPQLKKHIIIVPGNHDNEVPNDWEKILNNRDIFQKYCGRVKTRDNVKEQFATVFEEQFCHYLEFSEHYESQAIYNNNGSKFSNKLSDLAGIRRFANDNICFVPINTEWLYVPHSKIKSAIKSTIKKRNRIPKLLTKDTTKGLVEILDESADIVERCSLCSPLIKDAYLSLIELQKKEDYTIVTVMHRGPEYLPYEDKNPTDKAKTDSLGMILNLSDILLTGHEHQTRATSHPSKIGSSVLHFKLGSVGRKERMTSEHVRWASLIHIDPISGIVEHLPIVYNNTSLEWDIKPKDYPISHSILRNKYENSTVKEVCWRFGGTIPVIRVKGGIDAIIEGKIRHYFGATTVDKNLTIINSKNVYSTFKDSGFVRSIEESVHGHQQKRIVVYYCDTGMIYGSKMEKEQYEIMKKVDEFRRDYSKFILLNMLVINEVIVNMQ